MWKKAKRMLMQIFPKKLVQKDQVISFDGGSVTMKDVCPAYKLEPDSEVAIHTKFSGRNAEMQQFEFDVNGKQIFADDIISAQREYLKRYSK